MSKKRGWSGIGMATVGIDPTNFGILNGHPTKIPPGEILGGVVKNCRLFVSVLVSVGMLCSLEMPRGCLGGV